MNKIIVVGPSGAGKSTFSRKLGPILNIPVIHLDNIFWKKDKTHISREEFDKKLGEVIKEPYWIIDGDYSRSYETRMQACDMVIFLNYPIDLCLRGVEERIGKIREDIPWVEDKIDPEFIEWIKNWEQDKYPQLLKFLNKFKDTKEIIIFKTREEADDFLEMIKNKNAQND